MSAYATPQRERAARLLQREPDRVAPELITSFGELTETRPGASSGIHRVGVYEASLIDSLLDRLVERLAVAVAERLGSDRLTQDDEWLDSGQAAEYLGLHRDTLRRLAAAREIPVEQNGHGCKLFFRRAVLDDWRRSGGRRGHLAAVADEA